MFRARITELYGFADVDLLKTCNPRNPCLNLSIWDNKCCFFREHPYFQREMFRQQTPVQIYSGILCPVVLLLFFVR